MRLPFVSTISSSREIQSSPFVSFYDKRFNETMFRLLDLLNPCHIDTYVCKMYNKVQNSEQNPDTRSTMKQVSFTEFRRNAASLFNAVEQGETIRVLRHGKPIADVIPHTEAPKTLAWKKTGPLLETENGASLSREILRERRISVK